MSNQELFYLVVDVGGTNLRSKLKNAEGVTQKKFYTKTSDHKSFDDFVHALFSQVEIKTDQVLVAVSIASKIQDNVAITQANFSWEEKADGNKIKEKFNFKELVLLNDFESCGYSVPIMDQSLFVPIKGSAHPDFNKDFKVLLVGPGTGLGVCLVSKRKGETYVLPSEGGHIGLCACDEDQFEFQQFAKQKFNLKNQIISAEWLFCGRAIPHLYEFHAAKKGVKLETAIKGEDVFSKIDTDPIALAAFQDFLKLLGTCLSHLAVAFLPDQGILLSGAIIGSIIHHIQKDAASPDSVLLSSFLNNNSSNSYLSSVPIFYTSEVDLPLRGCWHYLQLLKIK